MKRLLVAIAKGLQRHLVDLFVDDTVTLPGYAQVYRMPVPNNPDWESPERVFLSGKGIGPLPRGGKGSFKKLSGGFHGQERFQSH
jgi:hypothetical protein